MRITILTVCPALFESFLRSHEVQRAVTRGLAEVEVLDIRTFAPGSFRNVDDSPLGGGRGMVLRCGPVRDAIAAAKAGYPGKSVQDAVDAAGEKNEGGPERNVTVSAKAVIHGVLNNQACTDDSKVQASSICTTQSGTSSRVVLFTPAGRIFNEDTAHRFASLPHLILVCGHYEGFDERIMKDVDETISLGDFVLTGGELPAMTVADAVLRLLKGNLKEGSAEEESFEDGLLEYPQYTQPADYRGERAPEVLLSGDHKKIRVWRRKESLLRTAKLRPDLLLKRGLTEEERRILEEAGAETDEFPDI